jgi:tetratricopeptide (TPR) repeat protein
VPVPDGDDPHLEAGEVAELVARRLPAKGRRRILGHLLAGCGACRARLREELLRRRDVPPDPAGYDAAFEAAIERSGAAIDEVLAELEEGERLWAELRTHPPGRRLTMVRNGRRYATAGVLEALLREYREGLWREARLGLEAAELGMAIGERLDARRYGAARLADLQGEALATAANAQRMAGRCGVAGRLLWHAATRVAEGSGDPLLKARLLGYQGRHSQTRGRFERAARAFGRAEQLYRVIGERHQAARALVARAEAIGHLHPERGIRLIRRALPDLDAGRDPRLELAAHHSLAWYLNDAGQGWEARAEMERSAGLYQRWGGDAVASLSRAWLVGRIDRSLDELDRARRSYERAWAGFAELGMRIHLTMLAIDRAELKVAVGEPESAAALLAQTLVLVRRWGVARETLAVLWGLREAVVAGKREGAEAGGTASAAIGPRLFRQASLTVRRSWVQAGAEEEAEEEAS